MAVTAENVANESERTGLIWHKSQFLDGARLDIGSQVKLGEFESVVPVLADEFQRHRLAFGHHDLAGLEFES